MLHALSEALLVVWVCSNYSFLAETSCVLVLERTEKRIVSCFMYSVRLASRSTAKRNSWEGGEEVEG